MEQEHTEQDEQNGIRAQTHTMVGPKPSEVVLDVPVMGSKSQNSERGS